MLLLDFIYLVWNALMAFMSLLMNYAYESNYIMFLISCSMATIFLLHLKAGSILLTDLTTTSLTNICDIQPSPINIVRSLVYRVFDDSLDRLLWINYDELPRAMSLQNNGNTLMMHITADPNCQPHLRGISLLGNYYFVEAIFKWGGSEHLIDSRQYALELQVLHATNLRNVPFEYLTISYLFVQTRRKNQAMQQVIENLPAIITAGSIIELPPFDLATLFWPFHSGYYRYSGTYANGNVVLPTQWLICKSIFHISVEQLHQFETLCNFQGLAIGQNSRSVQSLGNRRVQLNEFL
ncbi:carbonic anhydrase 1 [Drosophila innubila]|uniref:carbonic anhydrase 1 n=1 Tax=Drosophila innubila TaxID=198719 RepID=UPI00148B348A|nr:carbonic anhydrase 1 [Drosophila innubila]